MRDGPQGRAARRALDLEVVRAPGLTRPRSWSGTAFDQSFVSGTPPALDDHGSYPSDRAAYAAVLANPRLAIVDKFFLSSGTGRPPRRSGSATASPFEMPWRR